MADDLESLILTISADTRQIQRAIKRLESDTDGAATKLEKAFEAPSKSLDNLSKAMGKTSFQTANIAAQFQDIAVQLAGGQSPFQIALQQGTQISSVLGQGQGGAGGAVKALGGAFLSLVSPISLVTIGLIALGGAAIQYLAKAMGDVETLDDHLKQHADLIKSIKDAYGEAALGLDQYARESSAVIEGQLRAQIIKLSEDLKKASQDVVKAVSTSTSSFVDIASGAGFGGADLAASEKYQAFVAAINRLSSEAAAGAPNIRAFREEIGRVASQNAGDQKLQELAGKVLDLTKGAFDAENAISAARRAIGAIGDVAAGQVGSVKELTNALSALAKIGLPDLTDRQKALEQYRKAIGAASGSEDRRAAQEGYDSAVKRIGERETEKAAEEARRKAEREAARGARKSERGQNRVKSELAEIRESAEALELEVQLIGKSAQERARAKAMIELNNAATREGITLTDQQRDSAEAWADRIAAATQKIQDQKNALASFNEISRETGAILSDAFKDAVLEGEKFDVVLQKLLKSVASKLIDNAFDGIFAAPKGGGQSLFASGLSAIFGSVGKNAAGTPFWRGGPTWVGEQGPEIVDLPRGARVTPNHALPSSGAPVTVNLGSTTVHAPGGDPNAIAAMLDERDRALTARLPSLIRNAQQRGQIR